MYREPIDIDSDSCAFMALEDRQISHYTGAFAGLNTQGHTVYNTTGNVVFRANDVEQAGLDRKGTLADKISST